MGFLGLIGFGGGATGLSLGGGAASYDPNGHVASGGVISDYSTPTAAYRAHIFNTPGDFVISSLSSEFPAHVEYLVMGGGGGGGGAGGNSQAAGGGGGAGGMKNNIEGPGGSPGAQDQSAYASGYPVSAATFPVSIGRGGARGMRTGSLDPAQPAARAKGGSGGNSYFGPPTVRVEATGGGSGGAGRASTPGLSPGGDGACGGGGGFTDGPQPYSWGGTGNRNTGGTPFPGPAQGYGSSPVGATGPAYSGPGAGGGGSGVNGNGGNGGPPGGESIGGTGGSGKASIIAYGPGQPLSYGGGGAGGAAPPTGANPQPAGGSGGGGEGASKRFKPSYSAPDYLAEVQKSVFASNNRDNTGSGGGGGGTGGSNENCPGGDGADGVVVVRYQIGQSNATAKAKATGGAISFYNEKIVHTLLHTQNFVTTSAISGAEVFAIGGGGGGGGGNGSCGGGGAGGAVAITSVAFDSGCTYTCTIGHGGQGGYRGDYRGFNGENTTVAYTSGGPSPAFLGTITAKGGGYGAAYGPTVRVGGPGGCGGGGAGSPGPGGEGTQADTDNPAWPTPQVDTCGVNDGGASHNPNHRGGGGGGCGGVGSDGDGSGPRNGGIGIALPTTFRDPAQLGLGMPGSPTATWYVGGGGGGGCEAGSPNAEEPSDHGKGGGGPGDTGPWSGGGQGGSNTTTPGSYNWISSPTSGYNGEPGYNNTGGGGGGGWWTDPTVGNAPWGFQGGNGGSGLILIAYPK